MRDDKRRRILAAATAVFAERDFHQVSVSEVASRAGVGKGTLYLYFPTKDDLHQVALRASLERVAAEVERAAEATAPLEEALREIVLCILRFFWRRQHLLTLVQRFEQRYQRRARERRRRVRQAINRVLARHGVGGSGPARDLGGAFLLGLARAAILEHGPEDRPETYAACVVDLFLHGLGGLANGVPGRRRRGAA
jgi:AcrR family transcriptional regulator